MTIYYTKDHEYIRVEGDIGTVGISDHAQSQLGDVVFAEAPTVGKKVKQGEESAVVESVKAASDIYAPVSGEIIASNSKLDAEPAVINEDPLGTGWFYKIKLSNKDELKSLMNEADYQAFCA
jgi:glycine cleavage system H protein